MDIDCTLNKEKQTLIELYYAQQLIIKNDSFDLKLVLNTHKCSSTIKLHIYFINKVQQI